MKLIAVALISAVLLTGCGESSPSTSSATRTPEESYPGPWMTNGPAFNQIAIALGRNSIPGCGEFHYRFAEGDPSSGEALVYCTRDGRNWTHYLVFYKIDEVMRIKAESGIPHPVPSSGR